MATVTANKRRQSDGKKVETESSFNHLDTEVSNLPTPPDGGWGWVVVFASFMIHVVADGISYSFGIFLNPFIDHFGGGRGATGWLGSLMIGVTWGSGPIASALTNKFGCRAVTIAGSILCCAGFIVSIFAPNIWFMYFSFGIVAGLGLGLIYLPAIVSVTVYFEKKRSLATGLAVSGSGVGTFIIAPFTRYLLDEYGWKGAILIEAGLLLNCVVFGALFRPVENRKHGKAEGLEEEMLGLSDKTAIKSHDDEPRANDVGSTKSLTLRSGASNIGPMNRKDVFYSGSLGNLALYNSNPALFTQSVTSLNKVDDVDIDADVPKKCCDCRKMTTTLIEMMDLALFKDVVFLLYAISNFLTCFAFGVPYIYLPDRGKQLGIEESESAFLISIIGISNTAGRILFGFVADRKFVNRLYMYNIVLSVCGICTALSSLATNYPLLATYSASYGMCMGVYVSLTSVLTVDLLGLDKLTNAFGLILFFQGVGAVIGPPIAGWLFDITRDYKVSFYLVGAVIFASGAILFSIPCIWRYRRKNTEEELQDTSENQKSDSFEDLESPAVDQC